MAGGVQLSPAAQRAKKELMTKSYMLSATSFAPNMTAMVNCEDGSMLIITSAFVEYWEDPDVDSVEAWVFLFAEHYEPMFFNADDLNGWASYVKE